MLYQLYLLEKVNIKQKFFAKFIFMKEKKNKKLSISQN